MFINVYMNIYNVDTTFVFIMVVKRNLITLYEAEKHLWIKKLKILN